MKEFSLLLIHLLTVVAKLLSRGGTKGIIAENLQIRVFVRYFDENVLALSAMKRRSPVSNDRQVNTHNGS
jgi:hypothetical protein